MSSHSSFSLNNIKIEQTHNLGNFIGSHCHGGETILLSGELGSGKTTLTQSIAASLGVKKQVTSPTFVIAKEYAASDDKVLLHCDMYRAATIEDLLSVGILEQLGDESVVTIIEWPEKVSVLEKAPHIHIYIELKDTKRKFVVNYHGTEDNNQSLYRDLKNEYTIHRHN